MTRKYGTVEAHVLVFIMMPKNKQKTMLLVVTVLFALSLDSVCWAFSPVQPSLSSITSPSLSLSSSLNTPSFFTQPKELSSIRTLQALGATTRLQASASGNDDELQGLKIIIAGAPASGKGTQCENIKKHYGVVHLSTGDMLRAAVQAKTPVGVAAKEYMDAGKLVPDDVIIGVVCNFKQIRLVSYSC